MYTSQLIIKISKILHAIAKSTGFAYGDEIPNFPGKLFNE